MKTLLAALIALLPIAAAAQEGAPAAGTSPAPPASSQTSAPGFEPGRVYAGVGVAVSGFSTGGTDNGAGGWRFRLGIPRSPRLALGIESGFASGGELDATWIDAGATFFPWGRYLYLRGAAGLSLVSRWGGGWAGTPGDWSTETGPNVLAGAGVAFGRPRGLTLTLNVDGQVHYTSRGSSEPRSVSVGSVWLGLDWY